MARTDWATVRDSSVLYQSLTDPHRKGWNTLYDLVRGTYYSLPLFILLGVVWKWGF